MPCGDKCQGEGKAAFWGGSGRYMRAWYNKNKGGRACGLAAVGGGYTDKRQKDKAQTAKAGRQYITVDKKGNYYKAPVYNG